MLAACGTPATPAATTAPVTENTLKIVASTSWVGAFALAAGAEDISIIAPSTIQHPPDYDPKPSDLVAISDADYVLYAGFEGFAARMQEAVGGSSDKLITVATENSPDAIHKEVTRLGELFGTQDKATAFLASFDSEYAKLSGEVKAAVGDQKPVVVTQMFVTPWVFFAGLEPAGMYGPMPMSPDELKTLSDTKPAIVFENAHMGGGDPLVEATGATKIDLINFPGDTMDLLSVFRANAETLKAAFGMQSSAPMEHSHSTDEADPFKLSVAQYFLDSAGFHGIAEALTETQTIDPASLSTVTRVNKVLNQTTWPADLHDQAHAFIDTLTTFGAALEADNVAEAVTLSETVHDAQHELSHEIGHWLGDAQPVTADASTFDVSVAQYFLDAAGFHGIATALSETQTIDPTYLSTVTRVNTVLSHTVWPADLNEAAQAFSESLTAFGAALEADNVAEAVTLSETVHDTQHELSHSIDHWIGDAQKSTAEADSFDVSVAQFFLDSAGFHGIATALSETQTIDPTYLSKVTRVNKVLAQTTWPADLNDAAQVFIESLNTFAAALEADNIAEAVTISETVHDAQHELSHSIDHLMEGHAH
jgi:zinc transport system substrate-binding protein